jgi:hypothetical protein
MESARKGKFTKEELVDLGFTCREIESLLNDWRKDFSARLKLLSNLLAHTLIMQNDDSASGKYASAKADVKMVGILPKRGTEEYEQLCKFFNIDPTLPVKFDWNNFQDWLTDRVASGQKVPNGVTKTSPEYTVIYRRKSHG